MAWFIEVLVVMRVVCIATVVVYSPLVVRRQNAKKEDKFLLLHISCLRNYIEFEFANIELPFGYDNNHRHCNLVLQLSVMLQ